jgi:hypothetical protein
MFTTCHEDRSRMRGGRPAAAPPTVNPAAITAAAVRKSRRFMPKLGRNGINLASRDPSPDRDCAASQSQRIARARLHENRLAIANEACIPSL